MYKKLFDFDKIVGLTFTDITGCETGSESIVFHCNDGRKFEMYHAQDCCENVRIEDINGDVEDLLNNPILKAEEVVGGDMPDDENRKYYDSWTWTFYHISTIKGTVTLRWLGESNGYYSESVYFAILPDKD